jgi:hypothetical protein
MPARPHEGQVPAREYEENRAHEGRMQLIEITVTGHEVNDILVSVPPCLALT